MERSIKILEEFVDSIGEEYNVRMEKAALRDLIEGYRDKDRDNKELCRLYERTAVRLQELGDEELAHYFWAQIGLVPTFTVDATDYYREYHKLRVRIEDMLRKYDVMLEAAKKDPTNSGVRRFHECMEVKMAILDIMGADWNVY